MMGGSLPEDKQDLMMGSWKFHVLTKAREVRGWARTLGSSQAGDVDIRTAVFRPSG